jgi:hypothetical protein
MLDIQGKTGTTGWLIVTLIYMDDEILTLSQVTWPPDETKILSGVSQSHMGDESIEIVQYTGKHVLLPWIFHSHRGEEKLAREH